MRLSHLLIVPTAALALLAFGGCVTMDPSPNKSSSKSQPSGGSAGSSSPASSSPAPAAPSSGSAGSATPESGSTPPSSGPDVPIKPPNNDPSGGGGGGSASAQTQPAQTPDERRAAIDRQLDSSLGTFDAALRKEQERTAQERDARDAIPGGGSAEPDAGAAGDKAQGKKGDADAAGTAKPEGPPASAAEPKGAGKAGNAAKPGDLKSDRDRAGQSGGAQSGSGASVRDIPDGSDDDIVARRLRKAAEQETDPELKDKLWREYIEYKKNAQGK